MKHIVEAFSILIVIVLNLLGCAAMISVTGQTAAAKEYKADVIAEIENSNFNPNVIDACIAQASANGYELQVSGYTYDADHDIQTAEVILKYEYKMPVFGITDTRSTRGIAR